LNKTSLSLPFS